MIAALRIACWGAEPLLLSARPLRLHSAKILVKGEPNVSYICSRYYRAPELIFGATDYTCCIDTWSAGCVLAELLLGVPLFPGESGVDQLVEIIKVRPGRARARGAVGAGQVLRLGSGLCAERTERTTRRAAAYTPTCCLCHVLQVLGTPTLEEIQAMNQNYTEYKFPQACRPPLEHATSSPTVCTPGPSHPFPRRPTRFAGQAAPVAQGLPPPHAVGRHRVGLAFLALLARLAH